MVSTLPIDSIRGDFDRAHGSGGSLVISSPTGSGKSTQVPRWCAGPVLVVEPRRVACRALASRVAELEGSALGATVGYRVRDEQRAGASTRILFVTPGVALRIENQWQRYGTIVLDELHERSLEVDLLLALLMRRYVSKGDGRLVAMSATFDGDRVARHLGGEHLHAEGRTFPVDVRYLPGKALLPEVRGLEERLLDALRACRDVPGDVLVFLPGKGEIASCASALKAKPGLTVMELHGGLTLEQQARVFRSVNDRKVVLATNVAETSLTVPGIGVVIDSGLVRQTRYHRGRGFLTLVPVARDSADQRTGRAGRTAAGVCYRLWSEAAQLKALTPPEIHRESLVPLVLAATACGERPADLPFLDDPKDHALDTAEEELRQLGGLGADGRITERGRRLFGLPLDVPLGRLLIEAETAADDEILGGAVLDDAIDLVAALAPGRRLFPRGAPENDELMDQEPLASACDAIAILRALRDPKGVEGRAASPGVLAEIRTVRKRLTSTFGRDVSTELAIDRRRLALTVLRADPRAAHIPRQRGKRVGWSNGGTEIELGRDSAVHRLEAERSVTVDAIAVLDSRALGLGGRDTRVVASCAMPLRLEWLIQAGLGRDRLAEPGFEGGEVVARIERVYAKRVLTTRREAPTGDVARQAIARLIHRGTLFRGVTSTVEERLKQAALAQDVEKRGTPPWGVGFVDLEALFGEPSDAPETWLLERLGTLGVESGDDLALLEPEDLLPPELPAIVRQELERRYPSSLSIPGAQYILEYDLARNRVTLHQKTGRKILVPSDSHLPRLVGLEVVLEYKGQRRVLRRSR